MLSLQNSKEKLFFTKDTHIIHLFLTLTYELTPSLLKTKPFWTLYANIQRCVPGHFILSRKQSYAEKIPQFLYNKWPEYGLLLIINRRLNVLKKLETLQTSCPEMTGQCPRGCSQNAASYELAHWGGGGVGWGLGFCKFQPDPKGGPNSCVQARASRSL